MPATSTDSYSLMIHGGTVAPGRLQSAVEQAPYLESLRAILDQGRDILQRGGSALDAVAGTVALLEDEPLFNAGRGSVLNELGAVEMDAAIMDGRDLSTGAVAAVSNIRNPVRLAQRVLAHRGHVLLAGAGALRFAVRCGMPLTPDTYFLTAERITQYEEARGRAGLATDPAAPGIRPDTAGSPHGTVGAVARDREGNLAAATSTGGTVCKRQGRIGDSPIVGAGVFADNASCAVSATGHGEDILRTVLAKTIADHMAFGGRDIGQAIQAGIEYLVRRVDGQAGVIVIDAAGHCASGFTTERMLHGWIGHGGEAVCTCTQAYCPVP